jgi:hypothetical protein
MCIPVQVLEETSLGEQWGTQILPGLVQHIARPKYSPIPAADGAQIYLPTYVSFCPLLIFVDRVPVRRYLIQVSI